MPPSTAANGFKYSSMLACCGTFHEYAGRLTYTSVPASSPTMNGGAVFRNLSLLRLVLLTKDSPPVPTSQVVGERLSGNRLPPLSRVDFFYIVFAP